VGLEGWVEEGCERGGDSEGVADGAGEGDWEGVGWGGVLAWERRE